MRHRHIDVFKGILTLQMVLAHCLQFFVALQPGTLAFRVSEYINLTTFSAFFFSFGYVSYLAYLQKPYRESAPRIFKNVLRMLLAYYFSGFAYYIFIDNGIFARRYIIDILTFQNIPKWSEFLLSFAVLMALILVLQPLMRRGLRYLPYIIIILSIASSFWYPYTSQPILAAIWGRTDFTMFPVIPYSIYFALGILFAQHGDRKKVLIPVSLISLLFSVYVLVRSIGRGLPGRFPPTFLWIAGSAAFIMLYYFASKWLNGRFQLRYMEQIGKQSLLYLLLSNFFIFSVKSTRFFVLSEWYAVTFFVITIVLIYYLTALVGGQKRIKKNILERKPLE